MESVFCRIAEQARQYEQHSFFRLLDGAGSPAEVRALVPALTFFVFAFQDILRLNEEQMLDSELKIIARQHRAEDAGHQNWFLHDARRLGVEPDIEWTFGREHRATRDASYRLISEVFRASDDRVRVMMPLVLEAAGHPFFSRVFRFFESSGIDARMKYFALEHWQVEEGHEMLQDSQSTVLQKIALPGHLRAECFEMVDRMFHAIVKMIDDLYGRMLGSRIEQSGYPTAALELLAGAG